MCLFVCLLIFFGGGGGGGGSTFKHDALAQVKSSGTVISFDENTVNIFIYFFVILNSKHRLSSFFECFFIHAYNVHVGSNHRRLSLKIFLFIMRQYFIKYIRIFYLLKKYEMNVRRLWFKHKTGCIVLSCFTGWQLLT